MPIKKLTKKLRKSQDTSIFHDSRADVRSIMEVCNELTDVEAGINEGDVFVETDDRQKHYKLTSRGVMWQHGDDSEWKVCELKINDLIYAEFDVVHKAPWRPEEGELFFFEDPFAIQGWQYDYYYREYDNYYCGKNGGMQKIFERVPIFKTQAEVEAHVRAKGWI